MTNTLKMGKLYILSGLSASGKSTFIENTLSYLKDSMVVSPDKIRLFLQGGPQYQNENFDLHISGNFDNFVWDIVKTSIRAKMSQGLTCFLDATNLTDKDRNESIKIAKEYNRGYEVLIFDEKVEDCIHRNRNRINKVPEKVIIRQNNDFERTSRFPHKFVKVDMYFKLIPETIDESIDLDIIGDTHGLYEDTLIFLKTLGYDPITLKHKSGRKLLFLGDFIDRGPDSIDMLRLVKKAISTGHYAIIGNHEQKLIKNYKKSKNNEEVRGGFANMKTLSDFLKLKEKEQDSLMSMLKSLPFYYTYMNKGQKYLFVHANILFTDIDKLNLSDCIYGSEYFLKDNIKNTDEMFEKMNESREYKLIRGHIPNGLDNAEERFLKGETSVLSLEFGQAFEGYLACYRFGFNKIKKFKCNFNYDLYKKSNKLYNSLNNLVTKKLAVKNSKDGLTIYKYSKKVFFDNLWNEDSTLLKARGIVLGIDGKIVQHPFDKVFNYSENGAGLNISNEEEIIYVEKLNGFLGNIGLNPYNKKLLVSTTGSLDSQFVDYIKDFVDSKTQGKLLKFFSKNKVTLSFEVIHPEDPHIIKYEEKDYGLHLIGVRGLGENDKTYTEEKIDIIAKELGFKRPNWGKLKFCELKDIVKSSKIEGYMVRKNNKDQDYILKFKTPHYLSIKFLGRMGDSKIKFMFANKEKFKMSIDEEFYPIVDQIIFTFTLEEFLNMDNEEKISYIQKISTVE